MSKEMRIQIDKFKSVLLKESVNDSNGFNKIDKVIRAYIKFVLTSDKKINEYVPNTHIAEVFKDVLIYSELENMNPDIFHNVKHDPYDSIGKNDNPDDYDKLVDGRYVKKETYSVGINDILIPEYFDLGRLKINGINEIHKTYKKLKEKDDNVMNNIKLGRIVLPYEYTNKRLTKSDKIRIK